MAVEARVTFYLGTHKPHWLALTPIPMFVSRRTLILKKVKVPRALGPWVLDSGGFTELNLNGGWLTTPRQYVKEIEQFSQTVGRMVGAAPQDWMCEPFVLQKTGLSILDHQARTVDNYRELRQIAPHLPVFPVLQGWSLDDYLRNVDQYANVGVDLTRKPLVGIGTVCRRQGTAEVERIVSTLHSMGINLHVFGLKLTGLAKVAGLIHSGDSMAWSYDARRAATLPGHTHKSCANCMEYAMKWREKALRAVAVGMARGNSPISTP